MTENTPATSPALAAQPAAEKANVGAEIEARKLHPFPVAGWQMLYNLVRSGKFHYFDVFGNSLCKKYTGIESNWVMPVKFSDIADRMKCVKCGQALAAKKGTTR